MKIELNTPVFFDVTTHSPSGFRKNADNLPAMWVYENDNDTAIIASSGLRLRANNVGLYNGYFNCSAANGFDAGKFYNVNVSGAVDGYSANFVPLTFKCITQDADYIASGVWNALTNTFSPIPVNITHASGIRVNSEFNVNVVKVSGVPVELPSFYSPSIIDILADTDELQQEWADAGRLDSLIDTILEDTNEMQISLAGGGATDTALDNIYDFLTIDMNDISITQVENAVWDAAKASHVAAGTFGEAANFVQLSGVVYFADVRFDKDHTNSLDEYTVSWFRNSNILSSGNITSPLIQVIKRSDGTDLVAASNMDFISDIGVVKKNEGSNRTVAGETYIAKLSATIDGANRVWQQLISRDG